MANDFQNIVQGAISYDRYSNPGEDPYELSVVEGFSWEGPEINMLNPEAFSIRVEKNPMSEPVANDIWLLDIAQSHHFTLKVDGLQSYNTPNGSFSEFLPVKSIQLNQTSYENMSVPIAVFGDFPLLNRKRVSTVSVTCYDDDNNTIEKQLRSWENSCFPNQRYVAYMEDIVRKMYYTGYNVKGEKTLGPIKMSVIPSGNISVSRDYSANDAKLLTFTLVCVGNGVQCQKGSGKAPQGGKNENTGSYGHLYGSEVPEFVN